MSRLQVVIYEVEETVDGRNRRRAVAQVDVPEADLGTLAPGTALDALEETTQRTGQAVMRGLLQAAWERADAAAGENHRRLFSP